MTKENFLKQYTLRHKLFDDNAGNIILFTTVSIRSTNIQLGRVQAVLNIQETSDMIELIRSNNAQTANWGYLIDMNKRFHIDHFFRIFNVSDFYPLDTNNKIEDLYN